MKKVLIEEWVLEMLWACFPSGAARNQLTVKEMAEFIRRWYGDDSRSE